ncbi:hypothetical protein C8R47DRAFT_1108656 [Mycena vitilis]|nr:hypothetical protein C8R47DRAFT_1108656 [Mycena vitilis]
MSRPANPPRHRSAPPVMDTPQLGPSAHALPPSRGRYAYPDKRGCMYPPSSPSSRAYSREDYAAHATPHVPHPNPKYRYQPSANGYSSALPLPLSHPIPNHLYQPYAHIYSVPPTPLMTPLCPTYASGTQVQVLLTDDVVTKVSTWVRRRCFNCCSTETHSWRRSTLSAGKVLCNKCGLYERKHSRPRPDKIRERRRTTCPSTSLPLPRAPTHEAPQAAYQPDRHPSSVPAPLPGQNVTTAVSPTKDDPYTPIHLR